ncbi:SRPBCC family protein [Kitasatospora cathayae]|uniref:SRPBCC family protein n=1 Tax=Kitasatospora cathayae TaxID=3004092 RepID=A0ABY7Q1Y9_9ACTN|nr:SRPBCC family protein [Kitasatospora sp. HUAS 3-15]WBP86651.1 SRPBCC family protein [Kitasatospora sp. HUAS 3-15]
MEITVRHLLRLREEFVRWDKGERHSFCVTQASLPLFRRFGEDYLLEPTPTGTRFTWTFAFELNSLLARPPALTDLPNKAFPRTLIADTKRHFGAA